MCQLIVKYVLFFYEIGTFLKSRQIWKDFLLFRGLKRVFFWAKGKPEKPKKMYSTKLFTFSEVSLAFPKPRKKHVWGAKKQKILTNPAEILEIVSDRIEDNIFLSDFRHFRSCFEYFLLQNYIRAEIRAISNKKQHVAYGFIRDNFSTFRFLFHEHLSCMLLKYNDRL